MVFTDAETLPNILKTPWDAPDLLGSGDIEYDSGGVKSLFDRLAALGVVLSVAANGLAVDAPAGVLSDDLVGLMRAHRDELLALAERVQVDACDIAAADAPTVAPERLGLGPGWVCPWCRSGDRLAPAEPDGLRCGRCDRLAFRFVGDGVERCDWVEPLLGDAPEPVRSSRGSMDPSPGKKRAPVVDRAMRSLLGPADRSG